MLHRSYSILSVLRNVNNHCADHLYVLRIGLARRHVSSLTTQKFAMRFKIHPVTNPQKIFNSGKLGRVTDLRWSFVALRSICNDDESKNNEASKIRKKLSEDSKQRITDENKDTVEQLKIVSTVDFSNNDTNDEKIKKMTDRNEKCKSETTHVLITEAALKKAKKRVRVDRSLERNFITPIRAMSEFLLKPKDLDDLPKTKRRSPYELEPPITVYWRKDVEAKAIEVWGSREALLKELKKIELNRKNYPPDVFTVKSLRDFRREMGNRNKLEKQNEVQGLLSRSGKVIMTALVVNACNFLFKLVAWLYTGSHSMFSECIHSAADTCNQLILAYGIRKSIQNPNPDHPYGYTNMRYVSSLISGVGIFCVGTGLSVYHGIHGLLFPEAVQSFYWAYFLLFGSLISEGATLLVALRSMKKGAEDKKQSFKEYLLQGLDPSVTVVVMEDMAAVIGVICASVCMGLTSYYESPTYDAVGSLIVGGLLGAVASFIIYTNVAALVGKSISQENLDKINAELEADIMIRAIHDVKGIDMGNNLVRYKAELDFDGRELTRSYLEKHDLFAMLEEVKSMQNTDEFEAFFLKHGENIVDMLGGEIDRIELKLKKKHPEIRHCDLEIL